MYTQTERDTRATYQTTHTAPQGTKIEVYVYSHSIGRGGHVCPTLIKSGRGKWDGGLYWSLNYATYLSNPWFFNYYYYLVQSWLTSLQGYDLNTLCWSDLWFLKERNKICHPKNPPKNERNHRGCLSWIKRRNSAELQSASVCFPGIVHENVKMGSDGESDHASGTSSDEVQSPVRVRMRNNHHRRISNEVWRNKDGPHSLLKSIQTFVCQQGW